MSVQGRHADAETCGIGTETVKKKQGGSIILRQYQERRFASVAAYQLTAADGAIFRKRVRALPRSASPDLHHRCHTNFPLGHACDV